MNSGCIGCTHCCTVAVSRGDGYVAFFYCDMRKQRITHLMPGATLPCFTSHDADGPTADSDGDNPIPISTTEVPS